MAFVDPAPATAIDGNILFDKNQDPIGVNTELLAVCEQTQGAQKRFTCERTALLSGTGYGKGERYVSHVGFWRSYGLAQDHGPGDAGPDSLTVPVVYRNSSNR